MEAGRRRSDSHNGAGRFRIAGSQGFTSGFAKAFRNGKNSGDSDTSGDTHAVMAISSAHHGSDKLRFTHSKQETFRYNTPWFEWSTLLATADNSTDV